MSDSNEVMAAAAIVVILNERKKKQRKKRSVWVKHWLLKYEDKGHHETIYEEWKVSDTEMYRRIFRMDTNSLEVLLEMLTPLMARKNTNMRHCIPPGKRLAITLRFLTTGESYISLCASVCFAHSTISQLVPEVCDTIVQVLKDFVQSQQKESGRRFSLLL